MIIKTQPRVEERAKVITHLIKVAEHLRNMNNFQTLNSFLAGLNSSAVKKLRASLSLVPPDSLQKLANLTDFMKKEVFLEALTHVRPPVIPFIGYFQSLLVGIELMPDKVNENINFLKYSKHYKCICDILQGELNPYKFKLVPRLFHYCSLLSDRESEQEIERIAANLEKEELRMFEKYCPHKISTKNIFYLFFNIQIACVCLFTAWFDNVLLLLNYTNVLHTIYNCFVSLLILYCKFSRLFSKTTGSNTTFPS